jgi:hypothetical protein
LREKLRNFLKKLREFIRNISISPTNQHLWLEKSAQSDGPLKTKKPPQGTASGSI